MQKDSKYEELAVDSLLPYENNARTHSPEQVQKICNSIKEFGFINPVLINKDNVIIAGHGRVLAAKKLGMDKVPCLHVEHLTEAQMRAYVIADNKLAEDAGWDEDLLKLELTELAELNFDIELTGFTLGDLEDEIEQFEVVEVDVPDEPLVPRAKLGDLYQLGNHRLLCGDSTLINDVDKLVDGKQVDLLVTDPPYNVNYEGTAGKIQNDNMDDSSFYQFLYDAFSNANAVMKPGASFYIWHADSEGYNFRKACRDTGWTVRQCLIWVKNAIVLGRQDYQWKHEPCLYGWKDGAGHFFGGGRKERTTITAFDIFELRGRSNEDLLKFIEEQWCDREDNETSVLYEHKPLKNDDHPTMKPIALLARGIRNSSQPGEIVLDLFGGSGSTLITCEQMGRTCYMMEYDPKFVDVIVDRWERLTGQKAVLLNGDD